MHQPTRLDDETLRTAADLRLVVTDMDGTLLDADGQVPESLWPLLDVMADRDITFCPASGRQRATLERSFARTGRPLTCIADNGTVLAHDGQVIATTPVDPSVVTTVVERVRDLTARGADLGVVVCQADDALVERSDEAFMTQVGIYYAHHQVVDDLLADPGQAVKVAVLDFGCAETGVHPHLRDLEERYAVTVSGQHWVDVMDAGATKGAALATLQQRLGIGSHQTVVFGDYLNDLTLMDHADMSFAMANAHDDLVSAARFVAPSHTDHGVVTTLTRLLGV